MHKVFQSYLIDWALFITLLITIWSGLSITSLKWALFGLKFTFVKNLHRNISIIFTFITILHLLIHRHSIIETTKKVIWKKHPED